MASLDGTDDVFDSREVIERIEELESEYDNPAEATLQGEPDEEVRDEYSALKALQEEAEGYIPDWSYGETFIHADYFTEYAIEMLSDLGHLPADLPSWIVLDEDATAEKILEDYTEFTFRGSTYYAR